MRRALLVMMAGAGTVMAAAAVADPGERGYRVPSGHLPPPGECRVWLPDRPPGQQPPPTSCSQARRDVSRYGGRVVYGGGEGRDDSADYRRGRRYDRDDRRYDPRDDRYAGPGLFRDPDLRRWAYRNFDRNGDGRITRVEADQANVAFFRYADRNRDGRISVGEYNDARARLAG